MSQPRMHRLAPVLVLLVLLGLGLCLNACRAEPSPTVTSTTAVIDTPQSGATLPATVTPTAIQPVAIFLVSDAADSMRYENLQTVLGELASQSSMDFQVRAELSAAEIGPETTIVVAVSPYPDFENLASQAPEVQFLGIDYPDLVAGGNISLITSGQARPDQVAFIAGYLAAVITEDWRVGAILAQNSTFGEEIWTAFNNGVIFFCGLCLPVYPPYPSAGYPVVVRVEQGATEADWQAAAEYFKSLEVKTVFIDPRLDDPSLWEELTQNGTRLIGTQQPPANLQAAWAASVKSADPAAYLADIWSQLVAGESGLQVDLPLEIEYANREYLSEGRQNLVEAMLSDLAAGYIGTGAGDVTNP